MADSGHSLLTQHPTIMKSSTLIIFALAAFIPMLSALAPDYDGFDGEDEGLQTGEDDLLRGEEDPEELAGRDEDVIPEGRSLGAVPAFGLGLLGGHVGSKLIRNVGSFLGLRKTPPVPLLRPPPAAYYPAPYVPAGIPFPGGYPGAFTGRSAGAGKGVLNQQVAPVAPFVPIPLAPALPVYYRSNEEGEQEEEDGFDNETR